MALELQLDALAQAEDGETLERFCLMTAVFREDDEVPVSILPVLWDVDEDEALDCAQRLAKEHFIQLGEDGETMSLLDVHRDYYACRAKSELAGWHSGLLRRSGVREIGRRGPGEDEDEDEDDAEGSDSGDGSTYWCSVQGAVSFLHHARGGEHPDDLLTDVSNLTKLELTSSRICGATGEVGDVGVYSLDGIVALTRGLESNVSLSELSLQECWIGDQGAIVVAGALKANTALIHLDLSTNDIGDEGASAIAEALRVNKTLRTLILWQNMIGADGGVAIGKALEHNTALIHLDLSSMEDEDGGGGIGNPGAVAIAEALVANGMLADLDLSANHIGNPGAAALAKALVANESLTALKLPHNEIGLEGAIEIATSLRCSPPLTELILYDNRIGPEGAIAVAEALEANTTLTAFDVGENSIGPDGAVAFAKASTALTCLNLNSNRIGSECPATRAGWSPAAGD